MAYLFKDNKEKFRMRNFIDQFRKIWTVGNIAAYGEEELTNEVISTNSANASRHYFAISGIELEYTGGKPAVTEYYFDKINDMFNCKIRNLGSEACQNLKVKVWFAFYRSELDEGEV